MYTEKHTPGKYERCESQLIGRVLYSSTPDDEVAFSHDHVDCYSLFKGDKFSFIMHETDQGFIDYVCGEPEVMLMRWNMIVNLGR